MYLYLLLCIFAVALIALIWSRTGVKTVSSLAERQSGALFTPVERSFYGILCQAAQGRAIVFGKVSARDVLKAQNAKFNIKTAIACKRVAQQHFDYVLCKHDDLSVIAVVALEDGAPQSASGLKQDQLLDAACVATGLHLHRFKTRSRFNLEEIRRALFPVVEADEIDLD
ncbi:MAG: hypothetical protein OFPI_25200 [Osedax symbiont Rs2]|nr:MAG: hypothetical protein OFPI_25200 [Osedax symbiont Rs2]